MFTQKLRVKLDISGLVNTVYISEGSSDAEIGANGTQS